jgi:hypothetical protein
MGPVGIVGGRGNGIVQNNPVQALKNRIAHSVGNVVHFPHEGKQYIGNVLFEPLSEGGFRITLRDRTQTFTIGQQLQGSNFAFDLVQVDRGVRSSASLVDNLDQTAIYGKIGPTSDNNVSVGGPEDFEGNPKSSAD